MISSKLAPWGRLLKRIHEDRKGAVSIEVVLVIAAIAIPVLIFILKFGWPKIKDFFNKGMTDLEGGVQNATNQN